MNTGNWKIETGGLRADLIRLVDRRSPRRWTLIDSISGRISRMTRRDWLMLDSISVVDECERGDSSYANRELVAQATNAGLLRRRVVTRQSGVVGQAIAGAMRAVAFRVPLVSIDRVAERLSRHSSILFSPVAIGFWTIAILVALLSVLLGWSRAEQSIAMVYGATGSTTAIGYSLAALFVLTKCIHELGHAAACRRLGVPVGDVGLFFFCGVPCPYCDVSQVWRLDSPLRRAAVMMAGVYVELVLATIATLIWWLTPQGAMHVIAMNTMVLCGLSTLVFNANPLMRLDGYYVLSDMLGTPNLRRQAAIAWRGLITNRLAGVKQGRASLSVTSGLLSIYHFASSAYRIVISAVVVMFFMSLFSDWNLWWIGFALVVSCLFFYVCRFAMMWVTIFKGQGIWRESSMFRRWFVCFGVLALLALLALIPLRRDVHAVGILDIADAVELYVPESGWIDQVHGEIGDLVVAGDPLLSLRDEDLNIKIVAFKTKRTMAALESTDLKRKALRNTEGNVAWKVDLANRELVESQYNSLISRMNRLHIAAPITGTILPPSRWYRETRTENSVDPAVAFRTLRDFEGKYAMRRKSWCRVGDLAKVCVTLLVSAEQRQPLKIGNSTDVLIDDGVVKRMTVIVDEINELERSETRAGEDSVYVVKCRLPMEQIAESTYGPIGTKVEARICVDHEPVWAWLQRSMNEALGG